MNQTALIGIDWGTSNLRGFRYEHDSTPVERRRVDAGLKQIAAGEWDATFRQHFGDWLAQAPDAAVLFCGMVGSRQGWCEASYVECPLSWERLSANLHPIPETSFHIVPGLCTFGNDDIPDVMRGEETQLAGLQAEGLDPTNQYAVCLPGTHSKWVEMDGGEVVTFRTLMTGEVFDVLMRHSLLGRMADSGSEDEAAFLRGVDRGFASPGLLHELFGVRTLRLFERLTPTSVADYLSGLLIGSELSCVADLLAGQRPIVLVGSQNLRTRYEAALTCIARPVVTIDGESAAARGLWRIASEAGLVRAS